MPQDLRAFHAHLQACRSRQETVLTSLSIATLDGAVIPVQLASRPSTAGLEYRLLTTITDMSERERADGGRKSRPHAPRISEPRALGQALLLDYYIPLT